MNLNVQPCQTKREENVNMQECSEGEKGFAKE